MIRVPRGAQEANAMSTFETVSGCFYAGILCVFILLCIVAKDPKPPSKY